jgi:iron complex outermembrane recepter protein
VLLRAIALLLFAVSLGAQDAPPPDVPATAARIDVVASAPVDAAGLERNEVPANVLIVEAEAGASSTDALARSTASVQLNDAQHNPLQRDVQFRGFTASPLLGVPQGLAVYADGARMNEPFGDVVNWDLLPDVAVEQIEVLPGSNPLFGLNALGGVLSLRTRSGRSSPGMRASVAGGSLGLVRAEGAAGFGSEPWDGFVAASAMRDEGWRDFSKSRHGQLFAKASAVRPRAFFETSLTFSDGNLRGNGPAPAELLEEDRRAVFTHPDVTENRAAAVNGRGEWHLARDTIAVVHLHARRVTTDRFNGDDSPFEPCAENEEVLCEEDSSEEVLSMAGDPIPSVIGGAPADGANNTSRTVSDTGALTAQVHRNGNTGAIRHQLLGGITAEGSRSRFSSALEIASLTPDRGTLGHAIYAAEDAVGLDARSRLFAMHVRDAIRFGRGSVLLAVRHQRSTLDLEDRLGDELTGRHTFSRTNASLGATYGLSPRLTLFASAGEASRAPTAVEVTCADPEDPCRLPNAFVSDPPLRQVVARTFELGARGETRPFRWSAAAFDATNRDDILFIASGTTQGEGFFANVGTTRRRGLEALVSSPPASRVAWMVSYALLDATFGDAVTMPSRSHPLAEDGQIEVQAGDRIPGLSRHAARGSVTVPILESVRAEVGGRYQSSQFVRGDEANLLRPLPGFTVWNASVAWNLGRRIELTAAVENVLNERYATFGLLADADDVLGDDYEDPLFVSPGAPRNVRVVVSWRW